MRHPHGLRAAAGAAGASAWFGKMGNRLLGGVAYDGGGNAYFHNQDLTSQLSKVDTDGNLVWQKTLRTGLEQFCGVAIDGSGFIYTVASDYDSATARNFFYLYKVNTSGVIQWSRKIDGGSGSNMSFNGNRSYQSIAVDSSSNIYVTYFANQRVGLFKFDSSGTLQFSRAYAPSTVGYNNGCSVAIDSSDNVYVTSSATSFGTASTDLHIMQVDGTGGIVWQRAFTGSGAIEPGSVAIGPSGNIYVSGLTNISGGAGAYDMFLAKIDNSGNLQWQSSLGGSGNEGTAKGVAVDSSENIYIIGTENTYNNIIVAKYNSSGTLQWQRYFGRSAGNVDSGSIAVTDSEEIFFTGKYRDALSADKGFIAKVFDTGNPTGTYDGVTYAPSSLTSAGRSIGYGLYTYSSITAPTLTVTDPGDTSSDSSVTFTKVPMS